MKSPIHFSILPFLFFISSFSFSQTSEFNTIRISKMNYTKKWRPIALSQVMIYSDTNFVDYHKKPNKKYKRHQTNLDLSLFSDSSKMERIKQISKSYDGEGEPECRYHNEYRYYKIEQLFLDGDGEDEVYGELFLINTPYECQNEEDKILVSTYLELIQALFKEIQQ